jgi:hypothetical protein
VRRRHATAGLGARLLLIAWREDFGRLTRVATHSSVRLSTNR